MKIVCPPLKSISNSFLDILTVISVLINFFVIYCLIFRSPPAMSRYRWFLLWHQSLSFFSDIFICGLYKPIIFIPYLIAYQTGPLRYLIPTSYMNDGSIFLLSLSCISYTHLFYFRYLTVKGIDYFPLKHFLPVALFYSGSIVTTIGSHVGHNDDQGETFQEYANIYTCITEELRLIPSIVFDNALRFVIYVGIPTGIGCFFMILMIVTLVKLSLNHLKTTASLSTKTKELQHRLLRQLVVQALVPILILFIPGSFLGFTVLFGIHPPDFLWAMMVCAISLFSTGGGIVLICMNKTYRETFCGLFRFTTRGRKKTLKIVSQK